MSFFSSNFGPVCSKSLRPCLSSCKPSLSYHNFNSVQLREIFVVAMVSKAVQVKGMKLLLIAAVLCGELLMTKCTSLREFRLFPTTGPLQTLGPNPTLFTRLTYSECFIKCSMDPLCTGHSYSPGSGTGRAGSRCWTGHFHPHYFAQEGDEETDLQFWATYSPEQSKKELKLWHFYSSPKPLQPMEWDNNVDLYRRDSKVSPLGRISLSADVGFEPTLLYSSTHYIM